MWEDKIKFRGKECPNPTYCPQCVKNHYKEDEDANYTFNLFVKATQPGTVEAVCSRCGYIIPLQGRHSELC